MVSSKKRAMNDYDIWVNLKPGTDFKAALYRDFPDPVREG